MEAEIVTATIKSRSLYSILKTMICLSPLALGWGFHTARGNEGAENPQQRNPKQLDIQKSKSPSDPESREPVTTRDVERIVETLSLNLMPCTDDGFRDLMQSWWAIQTIEGGRDAVPMLVQTIKGAHYFAGGVEWDVLKLIGPNAEQAVPDLVDLLKSAINNRTVPGDQLRPSLPLCVMSSQQSGRKGCPRPPPL